MLLKDKKHHNNKCKTTQNLCSSNMKVNKSMDNHHYSYNNNNNKTKIKIINLRNINH
jgi:hypothetical protein